METSDRTAAPPRAVLICESPFWEHALQWILRGREFDVVARAREIHRALELVARHEPDVLVLEVDPGADPDFLFKCLRHLHRDQPRLATVLVCDGDETPLRDAALAGGASRVVDADDAAEFLHALDAAAANGGAGERPLMTRRELEILRLVAQGYTNHQVARALWVTDETVKYHLANVYRKVGVRNRGEAVDWAAENGCLRMSGGGAPDQATPRDAAAIPSFGTPSRA